MNILEWLNGLAGKDIMIAGGWMVGVGIVLVTLAALIRSDSSVSAVVGTNGGRVALWGLELFFAGGVLHNAADQMAGIFLLSCTWGVALLNVLILLFKQREYSLLSIIPLTIATLATFAFFGINPYVIASLLLTIGGTLFAVVYKLSSERSGYAWMGRGAGRMVAYGFAVYCAACVLTFPDPIKGTVAGLLGILALCHFLLFGVACRSGKEILWGALTMTIAGVAIAQAYGYIFVLPAVAMR